MSDVRAADSQYMQSLNGDTVRAPIDFDNIPTRESSSSYHPKKELKATPRISLTELSELGVLPRMSVNDWLVHTSTMLVYDWFPLTYFAFAAILSPEDDYGCKLYGLEAISNLLFYVYAPVLVLRFAGLVFM